MSAAWTSCKDGRGQMCDRVIIPLSPSLAIMTFGDMPKVGPAWSQHSKCIVLYCIVLYCAEFYHIILVTYHFPLDTLSIPSPCV